MSENIIYKISKALGLVKFKLTRSQKPVQLGRQSFTWEKNSRKPH